MNMPHLPFEKESELCRSAQRAWSQLSIRDRLRLVRSFRHLLVDRADELTAAVKDDVGRPPGEVLGSDVLPLAEACRFLERRAKRLLAPRRVERPPMFLFGEKDLVHHRPHRVVGIIGTWNYPLLLNGGQLLQALVAGNGVLWKPSEHSSKSSAILKRMLDEAGFPSNLVQLLPAEREAGPQLLDSNIDYLVFTGSAGVGRQIAKRCAERMIPSTLELSGIDAMFVLDDADVEMAAKAAWFGVTLNRGQTCLAVRRIFVQSNIYESFLSALRPKIESAQPMRLVMKSQVEQMERLLDDAKSKGGQVLRSLGDFATDDQTILPQVVINGSPEMQICNQDCFAPIAAVMIFQTVEDALALDAQCSFALGASIFTSDKERAQKIATHLRTGTVCINDVIAPTAHPATPFGGRYTSGWGSTQGAEGLLAMTVPQVVSVRGGKFRPHYDGATPELERLLRRMLEWSHAPTWTRRLKGFWNTVWNIRSVAKQKQFNHEH
jgi:acyl-CoA reductase-like NAD-dependent aldehyde dehydrogenase